MLHSWRAVLIIHHNVDLKIYIKYKWILSLLHDLSGYVLSCWHLGTGNIALLSPCNKKLQISLEDWSEILPVVVVVVFILTYCKWGTHSPVNLFLCEVLGPQRDYKNTRKQQDGGTIGGHRVVHLSLRIHQEYTFRHRRACRTLAETG